MGVYDVVPSIGLVDVPPPSDPYTVAPPDAGVDASSDASGDASDD